MKQVKIGLSATLETAIEKSRTKNNQSVRQDYPY